MGQGKDPSAWIREGETQGAGRTGKECLIVGSGTAADLPITYTSVCVVHTPAQPQGRKHTRKYAEYARQHRYRGITHTQVCRVRTPAQLQCKHTGRCAEYARSLVCIRHCAAAQQHTLAAPQVASAYTPACLRLMLSVEREGTAPCLSTRYPAPTRPSAPWS